MIKNLIHDLFGGKPQNSTTDFIQEVVLAGESNQTDTRKFLA